QTVPLHKKIEFLRRYLEIEQIRFGDRLQLRMDLEPATLDAFVPNLLLQPLVENAIRHAIEPQTGTGRIELRSYRDNGHLVLSVSDNGPGTPANLEPLVNPRERVGLTNTRERLGKLYGDGQRFEMLANAMGGLT